jgi:hypothetical protein
VSRQVEITIHTKQRLIIHGAEAGRGWWPQCNREADVVALDKARLSAGVDEANIAERLRSGGWHTSMSLNGPLRVCVASMLGAAPGLETVRRLNPGATPTKE